jgi:outer membrane protein assembly factor BamB
VFAQDLGVYGVGLAGLRVRWHWRADQPVYGTWAWRGTVVVLTGQVSAAGRLTALDASTGAVRWTFRLGGSGLLGSQAMTGDGGLAVLRPSGKLQVVDMETSRVRWTARAGTLRLTAGAGPVAAGTVVAAGLNDAVRGYDSRTGSVVWTVRGMPADPLLALRAGLVLVTSGAQGGSADPTAVTAIEPRTGRVAWRFDPGTAVTVLAAGPAGIVTSTYNPRRMYLIASATGRVRWQATTFVAMDTAPVVTGTDVVGMEMGGVARVVDRRVTDGSVRWSAATGSTMADSQPLALAGEDVIAAPWSGGSRTVSPVTAYRLTSGVRDWRVPMPSLVQVAAVTAGADLLVQSSDPGYGCAVSGADVGSVSGW